MSHKSLFLSFSVCIIWGTTWMAMALAVASIPPVLATGLRFLIASPILILLARAFEQPLLFPKGKLKWMLLVAVCYFAIPFTLMIFGEQYISSGIAAIIFANMPIAVMLASTAFLGLRLAKHQMAGLLTAVVSLCLILMKEMQIGGENYLLGTCALGGAVAMHSLMYVMLQKHCRNIPVFTYNALPCLMAAILLLGSSGLIEHPNWSAFTVESLLSVAYLGVIASVGGIAAYFKLNEIAAPFTASLCFLLFPVVALVLSACLTHQPISLQSMIMLMPLLAGIWLTKTDIAFWTNLFKTKKLSLLD